MDEEEKQECQGCGAMAKCMVCPTCRKLGINGSYFCTQTCFKKNWGSHKVVHKLVRDAARMAAATPARGGLRLAGDFTGYAFTGPLRPAAVTDQVTCPPSIAKPDYALDGIPTSEQAIKATNRIDVLSEEQQDAMRHAGRIGREVLDVASAAIKPGVTGDEIDKIVHAAALERNSYPSPLNYYGFPKSVCVSVNEVICHGIPDTRPLENGDIVNLDITVYVGGHHADLNETFFVGEVDEESKRLVKTAYDCLAAAVAMVRPGVMYRELGKTISKIARAEGFTVVRSYCGHGVNHLFHGPPNVPHYAKNKAVGVMKEGHTFTIEPMINAGSQHDQTWPDNWTAVTKDGKRSAQFEHTLLVTKDGVEILTARPGASRTEMVWDEAAVQRPALSEDKTDAAVGEAAGAGDEEATKETAAAGAGESTETM